MKWTLACRFHGHDNNFNLLRLLAALAVIYGHASAVTGHGPADFFLQIGGHKFIGAVAVDVFFVTSGFLVTASILSGKGMWHYFASRALRIYPALIVCVLLSIVALWPLAHGSEPYWSRQTWKYLTWNASGFATQYNLPGVFLDHPDRAVNGSLWSLVLEVRMYLLLAAAVLLGLLRSRTTFNICFVGLMVLGVLESEHLRYLVPQAHVRVVAMMFLIGAFCYLNRASIVIHPLFAVPLLAAAAFTIGKPAFPVVYTVCLPYFVFLAAFGPKVPWFRGGSDYSYGVYLYGWPAQQLVWSLRPDASNGVNAVGGMALALALAVLSWHLVERPAQRLKRRIGGSAGAARVSDEPPSPAPAEPLPTHPAFR